LHSRRFLSYHGDRFIDRSLVLCDDAGAIVGLLPAATDRAVADCVTSHPGSSYGGIVRGRHLRGPRLLSALETACATYRRDGVQRLRYAPTPAIYHRQPAQDDLYALSRLGAKRFACQLSSTITLAEPRVATKGREAALRRARREGVVIDGDPSC